jgi:hypothetical protein
MTVTAKSAISAFYGTGPRFAYFNGCSTGGRQGLMRTSCWASRPMPAETP